MAIELTTRFWSVSEVASSLAVHTQTVRRWIEHGFLPATRVGHLIRIAEADVQEFVRRGRMNTQSMLEMEAENRA